MVQYPRFVEFKEGIRDFERRRIPYRTSKGLARNIILGSAQTVISTRGLVISHGTTPGELQVVIIRISDRLIYVSKYVGPIALWIRSEVLQSYKP